MAGRKRRDVRGPGNGDFVAAGKPEGSDYQLGDLDIPAPGAQNPRPQPPSPSPGASFGALPPVEASPAAADFESFGARDLGDDFGDPLGGGLALELDEVALPKPAMPRAFAAGQQAPAPASAGAPLPTAVAAVGSTVPRDANPNVLAALYELAGYGDPPTGWVSAGRYAIHVGRRRWAMRAERRGLVQAQSEAEAAHRTSLEELAETMVQTGAARAPILKELLGAVEAARGQMSEAGESLSQIREEMRDALSRLEQRRTALEQELAPFVEAERAAQAAVRKGEENLKRGQALLKRVEIELRALEEADLPAPPTRVAELEQQKVERKQALTSFEAALRELQGKLAQAQRELSEQRVGLDAVEQEKRALETAAHAKEAAIGKQTEVAGESYRAALRKLAEGARARDLTGNAAKAANARVDECGARLSEARSALDMHDRARDLYDHAGVRKGLTLFVVLAVLAVFAVLLHTGARAN